MRRALGVTLVIGPALVATYLFARGVGELVAAIHFPPSVATPAPMQTAAPVIPTTSAAKRSLVVAEPAPDLGGPCAIGARVVVLVSDPVEPRSSLAVLSWPGTTGFDRPMVRAGSVVGGRRVAAITSARVWLRDGRSTCFLDGTTERAAPKPPPPAAARGSGIERVDDTHVRVDRVVRDALLDKGAAALGSARVMPDMVAGKVVGMRLTHVPDQGVLSSLGLRTGDSLVSINGFDLTTPDGALEAFSRLRAAPTLELSLHRNGTPTVLRLDVQ
ncbi:MAG: hypothetical protein HYV09_31455 [Deltaproteobacteria bacterium]|nr:hypothetical protein [Deltaproteobacteria bacterium]